jgi:hypothetical protein
VQREARHYRLDGPLRLRISRGLPKEAERFSFAAELLKRLAQES